MIRNYWISTSLTGKMSIRVFDGLTGSEIAQGIWSAGEIPAVIGFLQDYLMEDMGHVIPRIGPELPEDYETWPARTWTVESDEVLERSM